MCKNADEKKIRYADVKELSEDEVYQMIFPDKYTDLSRLYELPVYDQVHSELKKAGVTLKLLWKEYKADCESRSGPSINFSNTQ